jgi:hypothetical protein
LAPKLSFKNPNLLIIKTPENPKIYQAKETEMFRSFFVEQPLFFNEVVPQRRLIVIWSCYKLFFEPVSPFSRIIFQVFHVFIYGLASFSELQAEYYWKNSSFSFKVYEQRNYSHLSVALKI